jgi:hypothetical protein
MDNAHCGNTAITMHIWISQLNIRGCFYRQLASLFFFPVFFFAVTDTKTCIGSRAIMERLVVADSGIKWRVGTPQFSASLARMRYKFAK